MRSGTRARVARAALPLVLFAGACGPTAEPLEPLAPRGPAPTGVALAAGATSPLPSSESGGSAPSAEEQDDPLPVPAEAPGEGYVGSDACAACHARNHASWHASYHRRMTEIASPEAILAPWEGHTPLFEGAAWRLEREGDESFATPVSASGGRAGERMRAVLTTGSHHYQIYWLASEDLGGLVALPLVWHLGDRAWLPRRSQFLLPPHVETSFEFDRWQRVCIKCHTTNGTPELPPEELPRAAEMGIACEACHGPGETHVAHQRALAAGEEPPDDAREAAMVDPSELPHDRSAMVCGQCHGIHPMRSEAERERWRREGFAYRPGDDLAATRELLRGRAGENSEELTAALSRGEALRAELFWSDGEVRVSGREYNGLVESPCFQRGELDCLSCHELHPSASDPRPLAVWADDQLAPRMEGPLACTGCHDAYAEPEAAAAHARHPAGSSGADCLNCHMPHTTWGLTKAIRSHTIASPAVTAELATGRPNACNLCHLDRPLGWTADRLSEWYGHQRPELADDQEEVAAAVLWALTGDAGRRALVAWALGWEPARAVAGTGWTPYLVSTLLMDPYDAVSRAALATARREARWEDLALDYTLPWQARSAPVRAAVIEDWLARGLDAPAERRAAVLVRADGSLDEERVRALVSRRDDSDVTLAE